MSFTDVRDFPNLQDAINASATPGNGQVLLDAQTSYPLNPGLVIEKAVGLRGHGRGSVLRINTSAHPNNVPLKVQPVVANTYTATGDLVRGDNTLALDTTTGLLIGQTVFMYLGVDPYDPNEEKVTMFNQITSINGLDVSFSTPFPEDIPTATHEIRTFTEDMDGGVIESLAIDRSPGISADGGITLKQMRGWKVRDITGIDHTGALVHFNECENCHASGMTSLISDSSVHPTSGRGLSAWGSRNCSFRDYTMFAGERNCIYLESGCHGFLLENIDYRRRSGVGAGIPGIDVRGKSTGIMVRNYSYNSGTNAPALWVDEESVVHTENVYLLNGNNYFPLNNHTGMLQANGKMYGSIRREIFETPITANMVGQTFAPPAGAVKSIRARASDLTGITSLWITSNAGGSGGQYSADLVANQWVHLGSGILDIMGVPSGFNGDDTKSIALGTDGTAPGTGTLQIEYEYFEI